MRTEVMAQSCELDTELIASCNAEARLGFLEGIDDAFAEERDTCDVQV